MTFMNAVASSHKLKQEPSVLAVPTVQRSFVVQLKHGLHARPCAILVQTLQRYPVLAEVEVNGERASGKSILGLMSLAAGFGSKMTFTLVGENAFQAMAAVERLFQTEFGANQVLS